MNAQAHRELLGKVVKGDDQSPAWQKWVLLSARRMTLQLEEHEANDDDWCQAYR
jgi:hypothetical protein